MDGGGQRVSGALDTPEDADEGFLRGPDGGKGDTGAIDDHRSIVRGGDQKAGQILFLIGPRHIGVQLGEGGLKKAVGQESAEILQVADVGDHKGVSNVAPDHLLLCKALACPVFLEALPVQGVEEQIDPDAGAALKAVGGLVVGVGGEGHRQQQDQGQQKRPEYMLVSI